MPIKSWIFFISFVAVSAQAEKMPLLTDATVTTTSEVLSRIQTDGMRLIKEKYSDLQKNFTPHYLTTGLDLDCRRAGANNLNDGAQYAGLRIGNEVKVIASGQTQTLSSVGHFDCQGRLIFTERIRVIGKKAAVINVENATKFVRFFEVQDGETSREYQIENAQADIVFSIRSQYLSANRGDRIYAVMEFNGLKWIELNQIDPSDSERRLFFQLHSGKFKVGASTMPIHFGDSGSSVLKTIWTDRLIEHLIDNNPTNQVNFDTFLGDNLIGLSTQGLKAIFAHFIQQFPETKKVESGVSDSPFLRALQLNYNRMVTGTEKTQVQLFLQQTIEDIKDGRLKVE